MVKIAIWCLLLSSVAMSAIAAEEEKGSVPQSTERLLASILKKDFDQFSADLQAENQRADDADLTLDMNQPDAKGKLLIIEAVRSKDERFVDALVQYGAYAQVAELGSGVTPLHIAVQNVATDIVRVLLAYGADPDAADKTGRTPRQMVGRAAGIRDLLEKYDAEGAAAFEEAPGTWSRSKGDSGSDEEFWYNIKTGESRWNTPPSCSWQRLDVRGQPAKYVNSITGQEMTTTPKALAWRYVHMADHADVWHNWAVNETQVETPHEIPEYLLAELQQQKNVRWYNDKSGEISWEDPKYHTHWRELQDDEGKPFYYNIETAESQYEVPDALAWSQVPDEEQPGSHFYFNAKTGESTWEQPAHLAWTKYDSDL